MMQLKQKELNALEPSSLAEAFHKYPPSGFKSVRIKHEDKNLSAFYTRFNLLTTLDDDQMWIADRLKKLHLSGLTCLNTLFSGTTVTEYTVLPEHQNSNALVNSLVLEANKLKAQLLIIKDLPLDSPLLSERDNSAAANILDNCAKDSRFIVLDGQALAYVQIDFSSIDEYLSRQSKIRRKDLRKKLKKKDELVINEEKSGTYFKDEALLQRMYALYLNVFEQSKYHFDKLDFNFFKNILTDPDNGGVVFLYHQNNNLIGFNICFSHEGNLVDKYVGFAYPQAREVNLYFVSWFVNLEYALSNKLKYYIAGWTDPEVKAYLGASFTLTKHAVYIRNTLLRNLLSPFKKFFENDSNWQKTRS